MGSAKRHLALSLVVIGLVIAGFAGTIGTVGGSSQQTECSFPVRSVDATGTEVTVVEPPETVVTLGPSAAQTMWEIGAREKVIGVSRYASYLDGAEDKANVSGAGESLVVVEKVIAQDPDLVLAPNIVQNDTVEKLRNAGLTVYRFPMAESMEDVQEKVRLIGQLTNTCEGANERVAEMERTLSAVEAAVEGEERPRVLYVFGGYTAGQGTFIDHIIRTAGGSNIAAEAGVSGFQQISEEEVVDRNPEYIVVNTDYPTVPQTEAYNSTDAVQNQRIITLDANYVSQPAPRTTEVVERLVKEWHPEAYEAALADQQATATATPTGTPTTTGAETETTATPAETTTATDAGTTETESPGMGTVLALLAVILGTIIYRRG